MFKHSNKKKTEKLYIVITKVPTHGKILLKNKEISVDDEVNMKEIRNKQFVYLHMGGGGLIDTFSFTVHDSINKGFLLQGC